MSTAGTSPASANGPPRGSRRRLFVLVVLLAGVAWAWFFSIGPAQSRSRSLERAAKGEFEQALPGLNRSLERRPNDAEVLEALVRGHLKNGDDEAAAPRLDRWIAVAPDNTFALRSRMALRVKRREHAAALADALALRTLVPAEFEVLTQSTAIAIAAGEFATAEELCREALKQEPGAIALRIRLADIRALRGDPAGSVVLLEALLRDRPGHAGAMQSLAVRYNDLGRPEQAIPILQKLVDTDPARRRTAGYQLSLALERCGRTDEARKVLVEVRRRQDIDMYREAIQGQPDNLDLPVRTAESLLAEGHEKDALIILDDAFARDPGFKPAHRLLADHYAKTGDAEKSAKHRKLAGGP